MTGETPTVEIEAMAREHGLAYALDHLGYDGLGNMAVELMERIGHLEHLLRLWPGQGPIAREVAKELRRMDRRDREAAQ